ncbi:tripartite tricarboxylate transporter substrate binding protein [Bordetella bronchialis]|uniref:MFS transporter n=1 Tax=Bordetella bronchialis TaxID=463025 RepID=A0A193FTU1_9BORD|nr:tripartite tricarboxylate transporter substrate binding protein [Bordetella bronchialis]ANN66091.1 MFS transporter [Bordetella bronchialis]ANN71177.1 MFS transporter [Bordetella bronchialis]
MSHKLDLFRRAAATLAGATALFAAAAPAYAAYPDKPVRVVVGFSAGGTTDVIARIMSKELTESLGQSFVVENKPGAGSNIGTEYVARSAPDGYTLYFVAVTSAINQTLYTKLNFDLVKDFAPVALAAKVPNVLVVNPQVPVKSVKELVDYAKAHPGKLAFASSGSGTSIHMAGELFKLKAGVDVLHVPYKGSAPALTDLIGGQVQFMFDNMPSSWPHVQSGKLRALAVTTKERSPTAPDLPTMAESGFPGFDVSSWFGLIAPKGTPPEVIKTLNAAMVKALDKPEVKDAFDKLGAVPSKTTPEQFGEFIQSEVATWATVVKASGARVD